MVFGINEVLFALSLSLLAGLATGVGSFLAFFAKRTNTRFLSLALGFSAGVMIYISFVEIFPSGRELIITDFGSKLGLMIAVAAFFGGIALAALIDRLLPHCENPHEFHQLDDMGHGGCRRHRHHHLECQKLFRLGILVAVALAIHNFPEGLATFFGALNNIHFGIMIAVAVAIHNIPEGMAVSIPVYYATGSKRQAFLYSFFSGLAEPVGALVGYLVLSPFLNNTILGIVFAAIAGVMIFISLDELLPAAEEYGEHHLVIYGLIAGMAVMALSLLLC
ncbi:MAG: zinc transporter ZupT [Patescibacteria group bacterium]